MQALDIARDSEEGADNAEVRRILEEALTRIWARVMADPENYILTVDEFSVFNYFQNRFKGDEVAVGARKRFWDKYCSDEVAGYQ